MLSWISKAASRIRGRKATAIESLFGGIPIHQFGQVESYLKAGYRKVWATWKCCNITAQAVSRTPFLLHREGSTTEAKVEGLTQLFKYPNPMETFQELEAKTVFHLKLTGNAYWLKDQPTLAGDRPKALYSMNPKRVSIVPNKDGSIRGYVHKINGLEIPLDPEEVIHFKLPHPDNDFYGLGEVEPGEDVFNEHINRNVWSEGFWKNGASPSGLMVLEDQFSGDQEAWEKMKAKWQKEYGGSKNSGKTAWLNGGKWKYQQLGLTAEEMQNIESSRWNVEQICHIHGVPLSVIGLKDAANYATADIDNQRFREYTVLPQVLLIQDTLNTDLIAGFNPSLRLTYNVSGLVNVAQLMLAYGPLFDRGGISVNEMRERAGLQRIDNPFFDQFYILSSYVPLELAGMVDQNPTAQQAQRIVEQANQSLLNLQERNRIA